MRERKVFDWFSTSHLKFPPLRFRTPRIHLAEGILLLLPPGFLPQPQQQLERWQSATMVARTFSACRGVRLWARWTVTWWPWATTTGSCTLYQCPGPVPSASSTPWSRGVSTTSPSAPAVGSSTTTRSCRSERVSPAPPEARLQWRPQKCFTGVMGWWGDGDPSNLRVAHQN